MVNRIARSAWLAGVVGLLVLGVLAALILLRWTTVLITFLAVTAMVSALHLSIATVVQEVTKALYVLVLKVGVAVGLTVVAICGYMAAAGWGVLGVLAVVGGTSPWVLNWLQRSEPVQHDGEADEGHLVEVPGELSDEQLCREWRRSFSALQRCQSLAERQQIVTRRQRYLDEFERRDPQAFGQWLETLPRAAGDPRRFFTAEPPGSPGRR